MARKEFIFQGFSQRSHVDAVKELFDVPEINCVLMSIAYIKESGVMQIEDRLRVNATSVTVFAGIRNDITSYQALRRLHEITGLTLYTVDTGTSSITFHPKIYLVRGASTARLVLGSANLTLGGLQNNIEAGMQFDFDLSNPDDFSVVDQIVTQIEALPTTYSDNIAKIESLETLEAMFDNGLIADELDAPPPRPERTARVGRQGNRERVPRIRLPLPPLHATRMSNRVRPNNAVIRVVVQQPAVVPFASPVVDPVAASPTPETAIIEVLPVLVWQSKPLTERDLNVPRGGNTNKTGSMNLDKGLLDANIDHRHYFRSQVFRSLNWSNRSRTVDEAFAKFLLIIKGINYGEFDLAIRHTTSTDTKAYRQRNAMTRLSWGPTITYIAQQDLIGLTLSLFRDQAEPTRFVLEMD